METIVIYTNPDGKVSVMTPNLDCGLTLEEIIANDLPEGSTNITITDSTVLPEDSLFWDSWSIVNSVVMENITIAKEFSHNIRRRYRDREFLPWDRKVTIPSEAAAAEAERELIRQKYAQIQIDIDAASDMTMLRTVVKSFV